MIQWCSNYHFSAPVDAALAALTPAGVAWDDSSWVDIVTVDAASVVTGVIFAPAVAQRFEFDIGYSGNVLATTGGVVHNLVTGLGRLPFPIPIDGVPNGATIQARLRKAGTSTTDWGVGVSYYKKPIVGNLLVTTSPQLIGPAMASPAILGAPSATPWSNGSWTDVETFGGTVAITGVCIDVSNIQNVSHVVELGLSNTPIWAVKTHRKIQGSPHVVWLKNPLQVPSGTLQARWRKEGTTTGSVIEVNVLYHELPL